jgi:c-di-GMP-binding flagellar brake protein YcgR
MTFVNTRSTSEKIELELWEKLVLQTSRDDKDFTFLSRVIDQSDDEVTIEYPTASEGGGVLLVGDSVHVTMTRTDAVWGFTTKVTAKIPEQPPRMILAAPQRIERNQRRRFVRVDYLCPCKWRPVLPAEGKKESDAVGDVVEATIVNLSAGGIQLSTDDSPAKGQYLLVRPLADDWPLPGWLIGRIAWKLPHEADSKHDFRAGVDFREFEEMTAGWPKKHINKLPEDILNMSHVVRQKLMQLVYHKQIELRKKGLL